MESKRDKLHQIRESTSALKLALKAGIAVTCDDVTIENFEWLQQELMLAWHRYGRLEEECRKDFDLQVDGLSEQ